MAEEYIHISRSDGEPWLPLEVDYVRGRIDLACWVFHGDRKYHVAKLDSGGFVGISDAAVESVRTFGSSRVPVNMLALADWPEWFGHPDPFLAPGGGVCNVVINDHQ